MSTVAFNVDGPFRDVALLYAGNADPQHAGLKRAAPSTASTPRRLKEKGNRNRSDTRKDSVRGFQALRASIPSRANLSDAILALREPAESEGNPNAIRDAGVGCYREPEDHLSQRTPRRRLGRHAALSPLPAPARAYRSTSTQSLRSPSATPFSFSSSKPASQELLVCFSRPASANEPHSSAPDCFGPCARAKGRRRS